ncbi:type 2 periplasmic-binding domain-containing protein [Kluyvera cryocrescens]|nr:hypothetical protein [Kluyvera cryocrescens]MEB6632507.1 hypothetical protein [Kluyvera cryocrescens]HDG1672858.1 hypothetical protein [Kluyvera cryocrescens]
MPVFGLSGHSLSGVGAAVRAGLGITMRTRIGMPPDLLTAGQSLPSAGAMGIMLKQLSTGQMASHSA